jgi:hypothetical protein
VADTKVFTTKNGEVLKIRPVDEVSLAGVAKDMERGKPQPPIEVVQTSSGPKEIANENHQGYKDALQSFQIEKAMYMVAFFIQFGVQIRLTPEQLEEVEDIRANKELIRPGALENRFTTFIYVSTLCPTMEELYQLVEAIKGLNTPSAEQVQNHLDTFRPGISGQANNEDTDAQKRNIIPFGVQQANAV